MFNRLWPFGLKTIQEKIQNETVGFPTVGKPDDVFNLSIEDFEAFKKDLEEFTKQEKRDIRALAHCLFIGRMYSKDPRTKLGSLILRPDSTPVSWGYNGFARGVHDTEDRWNDRETKHKLVVHGEINAIIHARESLKGCTLYVAPLFPCERCACAIINAGITRVVAARDLEKKYDLIDFDLVETQFNEAGVQFVKYDVRRIESELDAYTKQPQLSESK
jgi:dCMP deaminase